jgi:hypothetical protein
MSSITPELLVQIATGQGEVMDMVREMIGSGQLALLIATAAVKETTASLDSEVVSKIFGITERGAFKKIENTTVKTGQAEK